MASRQSSTYRQQQALGMTPDDHFSKRHKGEIAMPNRNNNNFNSYHFVDNNGQPNQHAQQQKLDATSSFKGHLNSAITDTMGGFPLPNQKMPSSIPAPLNNVKSSSNFNSHLMQSSKSNRSFRDSVDSDVMSNHTHSSDDSISCTPESKETYSSQFNHFSTANSVSSNVSLITKEKEEAIASLLCSPYPQMHSTDSSQSHPSKQQPQLNIDMTAQQVIDTCKKCSVDTKIISSIFSDDGHPPFPPGAPYPPLPKEKLSPPAPCVSVSDHFLHVCNFID